MREDLFSGFSLWFSGFSGLFSSSPGLFPLPFWMFNGEVLPFVKGTLGGLCPLNNFCRNLGSILWKKEEPRKLRWRVLVRVAAVGGLGTPSHGSSSQNNEIFAASMALDLVDKDKQVMVKKDSRMRGLGAAMHEWGRPKGIH